MDEHGLADICNAITVRSHESAYADIRLFLRDNDTLEPRNHKPLPSFEDSPAIASQKRRGSTVSVRLQDALIREAGRELEAGFFPGSPAVEEPDDPREYWIGFLGPNTCKPLHLGHLRNIIIGHALTNFLSSAGLRCQAYSLVGDIGRNVCEAMAGYDLFHSGATPERLQMKPDHFAGMCYRDYLEHAAVEGKAEESDPCAREHVPAKDAADDLLLRWRSGESATRERWKWFRDMVEAGHEETLRKLAIPPGYRYYESDAIECAVSLLRTGVQKGILTRLEDGMVVYHTGREEFRTLVLARSDGFPTEHGRVLAVFHRLFLDRSDGCVHIDWNGTEWEPAQAAIADVMRSLSLIPPHTEHRPVFHGMVLTGGDKMSSHRKGPVLIDDFIAEVRASNAIKALAEGCGSQVDPAVLSDQVIKGFFLFPAIPKPLAYSWERLMDPESNRGWTVARAWARAFSTSETGPAASPDIAGPSYRFAVLHAHGFAAEQAAAVRKLQVSGVTAWLLQFCEKYLAAPPSAGLDRVARTILRQGLRTIGFMAGEARMAGGCQ